MEHSLMRKWITVALCGVFSTGVACTPRVKPSTPPRIAPELATILVNYAAAHVCACLLVSGRNLESCKSDLDPAAKPFVSIKVDHHRVTATIDQLASGRARYEPGYGCAVENEARRLPDSHDAS